MSSILSTVLFASAAVAQVTTSVWLPAYGADEYEFKASVVAAEGDTVTMAVEMSADDYYGGAETITFHGTTAFENVITTTDVYGDYEGDITISYGCSQRNNNPVCVYSSNGPAVWSSYCEDYSSYATPVVETETYTFDSPPSTIEQVSTYDYRDQVPEFCLTGSLLPESYAIDTVSVRNSDMQTFAVTITAGAAKLSATAGATPSNSAASPTRTSNSESTPTPTGSSNSTGPTNTPPPPSEQSTAAAAPMQTLAPALAGLGALVVALF